MAFAMLYSRRTACLLLALCISLPVSAQKLRPREKPITKNTTSVIWHDRDISSLDLTYGPGGKEHAPGSTYTFLKEDPKGTNPKFEVEDENGVKWKIKLGPEARPETAATRLLWAAGYFADEDYYQSEVRVAGLPKLHRGGRYVSRDGVVHGARLERKVGHEDAGTWSWFDNDFVGQTEYNGLRVMMALMNNWDLKEINNAIHDHDGERRLEVADVGATFGKTGNFFTRSKDNLRDYANSKFIDRVRPDSVDLVMHSRPFFLGIFEPRNYAQRARMESVTKRVPRADARWLGQRLARLSPDQIRDCFRSAGYSDTEVEGYTKALQKRIAELNSL